jgi:hypothetical protein
VDKYIKSRNPNEKKTWTQIQKEGEEPKKEFENLLKGWACGKNLYILIFVLEKDLFPFYNYRVAREGSLRAYYRGAQTSCPCWVENREQGRWRAFWKPPLLDCTQDILWNWDV